MADVNRERAIVIRGDECAYLVLTSEVEGQRVRTVRIVANRRSSRTCDAQKGRGLKRRG